MGSVLTEIVHEKHPQPWSTTRVTESAHTSTPTYPPASSSPPSSPSSSSMNHHLSTQSSRASPSNHIDAPLRTKQRTSPDRLAASDSLALHHRDTHSASDVAGTVKSVLVPETTVLAAGDAATSSSSTRLKEGEPNSPPRIKVRDLQHIQSFDDVALDRIASSRPPSPSVDDADGSSVPPQYEISEMPVSDVIEMVAGLLTKITTTNDAQHKHLHRSMPTAESTLGMSQQTASVLAFHGKNVPNITIMSYLTRIHKYCPATFEVFLSLLVYFDRMTDKVNSMPLRNLQHSAEQMDSSGEAVDSAEFEKERNPHSSGLPSPPLSDSDPSHLQHFFVVDSYNIHRLVIAGVTCASKFFSDIFYTNSRYAKVGGLPLSELNHLELQFLLLNDFRLSISTEELEAYATMLVEFYAREIMAQRRDGAASASAPIAS